MHALRSLGKLVWGSKEAPEQFKLKSGVLYELHPDAKVSRKCIYKDAELGIRRTNIAFQYQLVVQRVVDEGEADLLEEADDERAFLIGTELRFSGTMIEGAYGFKWVDPVSTENIRHEFVVEDDACTKAMRDAFALAVARCVWERKARRPYTEAPADEVQKILTQVEDDELEQLLSNVKIDNADLAQAAAYEAEDVPQLERSYAAVPAPAAAAAEQSTTEAHLALPAEPKEMKTGKVIVSVLGALYLFDPQLAEFVQIAADVALTVVETGKFTYWMNVASDNRDYSSQLIEPEMNAVFNNDYKSLIWNYFDFNTKAYSFSLVSADKEHYEAMHQGLTRAAYETLNEEPWSKVSEASQDYLLDAYEEDVEMLPAPENWDSNEESEEEEEEEENESDEEEHDSSSRHEPASTSVKTSKSKRHEEEDSSEGSEYESESDRSNSEESEEEEESEDEHEAGDSADNGAKNSKLAVGYKHGRSFVVRGNRIGVFRHTDDDKIEFDTTINRIDDTHGKEFTPSSVMLHEQDSALVLMNQQRPHELYRMDLEYGKVVDEWKVHEDIPTVNIAPNSKFSQMTGDKTLVGISHNMLYRIDPRLGGDNLVVQNEQQAYATKSHFTSAATTESGAIAVGSGKGEVRLFDRLGVRAKTVLPALGEPIIGIDVTSDGRYVVATCKTYLLLIDTKIPTDPDGKTGFQKPFPQAQKPAPKRLQLKPEHVVYMGAPISFTPAKFNQSPDGNHSEKTIVTSTGPFVITWNLRRALGTGRGDAYQIKQYPDMVVADNFRFGQDRSIVVTLPNDVQSVKRSQLAKPTRQSLMVRPSTPGTGSSRLLSSSRNDIVDAPY